MNTFAAKDMVRFGWETFKKRPWFFIGTFVLLSFFSNFSYQSEGEGTVNLSPENIIIVGLASVAIFFITTVASMCASAFALKAHDAPETVVFRDIWTPNPFWRFVGAVLLKGIIISAPLALAMLLGYFAYENAGIMLVAAFLLGLLAVAWLLYASIRLMFVELIVMEKRLMPVEALKESQRMTEGRFGDVLRLLFILLGVYLLGFLALVVGIVVAIPVAALAFVHAYRTFQVAQQNVQ